MYTQLIFIMNKCQELGSFTDDQNSKLGAGREQGKAPLIYKVWYKWLSCIFDRILHNPSHLPHDLHCDVLPTTLWMGCN